MSLAAGLRGARLAGALREARDFYALPRDASEGRAWQLRTWNGTWEGIRRRVPRFRDAGLPEAFRSWEEFRDRVPPLERADLRGGGADLQDPGVPRGTERRTGGSTGEPVALPVSPAEVRRAETALWLARGWYGIRPSSRLFLLWGHAHLLGSGIRGRIGGRIREWKDALLGYRRHSAYDLSPGALRAAGDALLEHRPEWVLGYSVALDRFAAANADRAEEFRGIGLKAAVATAESFPRTGSREGIAAVLGCPVAMEYGSVETGPLAHEAPDGTWRTFWRDFLLELDPAAGDGNARDLLVTCLHPRRLPLVRYRIGDLAEGPGLAAPPGREIGRLRGRANDVLVLGDGGRVHSELVAHALRAAPSVRYFQVVRTREGGVRIEVEAEGGLPGAEEAAARAGLAKAHPDLGRVPILAVPGLRTSVAGKLVRVVDEREVGP